MSQPSQSAVKAAAVQKARLKLMIQAIDGKKKGEKPNWYTKEEKKYMADLAKEYSRLSLRDHRQYQRHYKIVVEAQAEAIRAIPEGFLREQALIEDNSLFPKNLRIPASTAGIEEEEHQLLVSRDDARDAGKEFDEDGFRSKWGMISALEAQQIRIAKAQQLASQKQKP